MEQTLLGAKILVTGATGFLGRFVAAAITEQGGTVIPISKSLGFDLRNEAEILQAICFDKPDIIVHLAATVGGIGANMAAPATFFRDNMIMGMNVVHAAAIAGCKLINVSTTCGYPKHCKTPFKEEDFWNGYPEETNAPYGIAKKAIQTMCEAYRKQYKLQYGYLIPANMFGPCFSEDTEVMTSKGIRNVKDVKVGDILYTLNPDTFEVESSSVVNTTKALTKEFFNFRNAGVDFRVTPDHKMFFKTNTSYQKREAEYFRDRAGRSGGQITFAHHKAFREGYADTVFSMLPYKDRDHEQKDGFVRDHVHSHSHWIPLEYNVVDMASFIGWFVTEGCFNETSKNSFQVKIAQKKTHHRVTIEKLLTRMGIPFGKNAAQFHFSSRLFKTFIEREIGRGSRHVRLPEFVFEWPLHVRQALFSAMMGGDGHTYGGRYSTVSNQLKDDFLHLAFSCGYKARALHEDKTGCWRIGIRLKKVNTCVKKKDISVESVPETLTYCFTVAKNHLVYAGRNGKFNWVGQCDHFEEKTSHVIPAMIRRFVEAAEADAPEVTCWGTGKATRSFLFAPDAAKAIAIACAELDSDAIVNLPGSEEISMKALAALIAKLCKYKGTIEWDSTKPDGQPRRALDGTRARALLGWAPETTLAQGLEQTIEWFKENRKKKA